MATFNIFLITFTLSAHPKSFTEIYHYNLDQQNDTLVLILALNFRTVTIAEISSSSFSDMFASEPG